MTWEDFIKQTKPKPIEIGKTLTDIECPKCGKYIYKRTDIVLTSYPPKYKYECECGWYGYNI